jgi:ankyrin repeat protein
MIQEILTCIRNNNFIELESLLREFKEPIKKYNDKIIKQLEYACENNYYKVAKLLVRYTDRYGNRLTGLDMCIAKTFHPGHEKISRLFYKDDRVLLEEKEFYLGMEIYFGNFKNFKTILDYNPYIDPTYRNNEMFIRACAYGNVEIMNYLLQKYKADPSDQKNRALQRACENNRIGIARLLLTLDKVNPADRNNIIFRSAVKKGRTEIVKLLLQHKIDPCANDNDALKTAFEYKNYEIMRDILNSKLCYETPQLRRFLSSDYISNETYDEFLKFYIRLNGTTKKHFDYIVHHTRFLQKRMIPLITRFEFKNFLANHRFSCNNMPSYAVWSSSFVLNYNLIDSFKLYFLNRKDYPIESLNVIFGVNFKELLEQFKEYESLNSVLTSDVGSIVFSYL